MNQSRSDLARVAREAGDIWRHSPYYDSAEKGIESRWTNQIWPFINGMNFDVCVDLAAGHGRNTRKLLAQPRCKKLYLVDINESNIEYCKRRFAEDNRVSFVQNNGYSVDEIPSDEVTCFYSFDSMVHFDSDVVRAYLREIRRVLKPEQGTAFLHHSNYPRKLTESLYHNPANPGGRNFMTAELFQHYACKEGLQMVRQQKIDWFWDGSFTDCFSLVRRPNIISET